MILDDTVKLNALARREPQPAIGVFAGQIVDGQILLGAYFAAGDFAPHHEHVRLAAALLAIFAGIAVVLLIRAVKLE